MSLADVTGRCHWQMSLAIRALGRSVHANHIIKSLLAKHKSHVEDR
jgi:hypothetical protein